MALSDTSKPEAIPGRKATGLTQAAGLPKRVTEPFLEPILP